MNHAIKTPRTIIFITLKPHTQSKEQYYNKQRSCQGKDANRRRRQDCERAPHEIGTEQTPRAQTNS
jgi:hypothetical protein